MRIPKDNPLTPARIELGRHLFYDPMLSATGEISCATCHQQRYAFADGRVRPRSSRPGARSTMPLFNLAWRERFFWDGRAGTLEAAVADAFKSELDAAPPAAARRIAAARPYAARFKAAFGDGVVTP